MHRPRHPAFSAAMLGAATIFVGCEETDPTADTVGASAPGPDRDEYADGEAGPGTNALDPNELPAPRTPGEPGITGDSNADDAFAGFTNEADAEVPGGDPTMGDSLFEGAGTEDPTDE